jgi:hypothetical protein
VASSEYYRNQADICMRLAFLTSLASEAERLRRLAKEYQDRAAELDDDPHLAHYMMPGPEWSGG